MTKSKPADSSTEETEQFAEGGDEEFDVVDDNTEERVDGAGDEDADATDEPEESDAADKAKTVKKQPARRAAAKPRVAPKRAASSPAARKTPAKRTAPAKKNAAAAAKEFKTPDTKPKTRRASNQATTPENTVDNTTDKKEEDSLIISADEELTEDNTKPTEEEVKKEDQPTVENTSVEKPAEEAKLETTEKKKIETSFVWVANITKAVKASSLKKHFSECGKVNTAKVVTNGKVYFGYVEFENASNAAKCVSTMNGLEINGRRIVVTRTRPDARSRPTETRREPKPEDKKETTEKSADEGEKKKVEKRREDKEDPLTLKCSKEDRKKVEEKKEGEDNKRWEERRRFENLRRELERARIEIRNLRRRLTDAERKSRAEIERMDKMKSEMKMLHLKKNSERRNFDEEISKLQRRQREQQEKIESERVQIAKERDDLRRRHDDLERGFKRLDDERKNVERMKRARKSRSLSPRSKRFRKDGGPVMFEHGSPPPAPKLSQSAKRHESPPQQQHGRPYYAEKKQRSLFERLGDYQKEPNGRHRGPYGSDSKPPSQMGDKGPWAVAPPPPSSQDWKPRGAGVPSFPKPYMERGGYGGSSGGGPYQMQPLSQYYPPGTSDYQKHHPHYDMRR